MSIPSLQIWDLSFNKTVFKPRCVLLSPSQQQTDVSNYWNIVVAFCGRKRQKFPTGV